MLYAFNKWKKNPLILPEITWADLPVLSACTDWGKVSILHAECMNDRVTPALPLSSQAWWSLQLIESITKVPVLPYVLELYNLPVLMKKLT